VPTSYLPTPTSYLRCHKCLSDLLPTSHIISKGFTGRFGRAYLVTPPSTTPFANQPSGDIPNTLTHKPVPRQLVTGAHTVSDISCKSCGTVLGWKYVDAKEEGQRYKVGKFILETKRVVRWTECEERGEASDLSSEELGLGSGGADEEVHFDSQDEDECEDLFSGVWSAGLARRRREGRVRR
jgi:hypothetical protein